MWHLGSLIWLEFRVQVMMRSENEPVSRNQIMEHALSHQKMNIHLTDGVPIERLFQWGNVILSFLEGQTTLAG